jgi:acid phosphatase type 7
MTRKLLYLFLAGIALLAGNASQTAAQKIVGGPFVTMQVPRTATIAWIVQDREVAVTPAAGFGASAYPVLHVEKTTLTGLQPNTKYEYSVAAGALKGSFKAPPAPNAADPYRFVAYGDTRTRHDVHRRVMETLVKTVIPDFVLNNGDQVENGYDAALWPLFFDIEKELLRQTVFFPSLGNHERNSSYYYELLQQKSGYYSFDWGNGHFTVLNTDIGNLSASPKERDELWNEQVRWLEQDLQEHQAAAWRFVSGHHPPMTAVSRRQGNNPHMIALMPMFEKYKVQALFFGHDHNYQHYLRNGIHYFVSGGGGAPLYDVDKPPEGITQKVASIENFVTVEVNGKVARVKVTAIDGRTLDEAEINAAPR